MSVDEKEKGKKQYKGLTCDTANTMPERWQDRLLQRRHAACILEKRADTNAETQQIPFWKRQAKVKQHENGAKDVRENIFIKFPAVGIDK